MAFTDRSDLFAAVHENGINATIGQLMLQRPSMFNYATILFTQALSSRLCVPISTPPGGGPLFTVEPQLPVFGAPPGSRGSGSRPGWTAWRSSTWRRPTWRTSSSAACGWCSASACCRGSSCPWRIWYSTSPGCSRTTAPPVAGLLQPPDDRLRSRTCFARCSTFPTTFPSGSATCSTSASGCSTLSCSSWPTSSARAFPSSSWTTPTRCSPGPVDSGAIAVRGTVFHSWPASRSCSSPRHPPASSSSRRRLVARTGQRAGRNETGLPVR